MNLFCASKLFKVLGTRPQKASAPGNPMADWYATYTTVNGEDVIAAVLLKFRFCVLLPDEGKDQWANLGQQLTRRVRDTLQDYPISPSLVDQYLPAETVFALGVPEGRTVTKLNAVVARLNKLAPQHPDLKDLQHALNDALVVASDVYCIPSKSLMEQIVHDYAAPVRAFELEAKLEHDGNTVRRTLLVSPNTNFLFLHRYLQQAFHWADDHLHEFTLPASKRRLPVRSNPAG